MTLKQYLNQKDPARMPQVVLGEKDYIVAGTITRITGEKRSRVYINTKDPLLAGIEYCLIGSGLYTVDRDGNPKNRSCFRIKV